MLSVQEINDLAQLDRYRLPWKSLLNRTPGATFFHTLDWLVTYWRHFGHDQKLRVLVVSSGSELVGILPLAVRPERTRMGWVRVLSYPLNDWGSFYGPVGPDPTATLAAGLAHVRHNRRDWDLLDLRHVNSTSMDGHRTAKAMRLAGFHPHRQNWARVALIDLAQSWPAYWSSRPAKLRQNVSRCRRRLSKMGHVTHLRYRPQGNARGDGNPRWDLYDASVHLAERSWQGSVITGTTLCHESVRTFLRDVHAVAAALGNLDLNLLLVNERPVAFSYNYYYRGLVSGLRMGYDPEFARGGPGTVLQAIIIEDSFRRGDHSYDLGVGSLACKQDWQTSVVNSNRYTHFPWSDPRANLLRAKRWLQDRLCGSDYVQYEVRP